MSKRGGGKLMIAHSLRGICRWRRLGSAVFGDFAHAPSAPSLQADPDVRSRRPFESEVRVSEQCF